MHNTNRENNDENTFYVTEKEATLHQGNEKETNLHVKGKHGTTQYVTATNELTNSTLGSLSSQAHHLDG